MTQTWIYALLSTLAATPSTAQPPSWDWQLGEPLNLSIQVDALDVDPDTVTATDIAALKARGVYTICYVSVGTLEEYRDDVSAFPAHVVGNRYDDWPDEAFLDIRQLDVLLPIMEARFQRCAALGFDAIEPDNIDVHDNNSGFPLTAQHTITYVRALADIAHNLGLEIGQKNAPDLTEALAPHLDFAVTENCITDGWCAQMAPYAQTGRVIYAAEYDVGRRQQAAYCDAAPALGLSLIFKDYDLSARRAACPAAS